MVIVKGMDMPKSCYEKNTGKQCRLCDGVLNCFLVGDVEEYHDKRHPHCPLQEIGGTNGDVIRALFGNNPIDVFIHDVNIRGKYNVVAHFDREWWDAPYKAESEGEE